MGFRLRIDIIALTSLWARGTHAQPASPIALQPLAPVGVWRDTSWCQLRPSPCSDEVVVDRTERIGARDSLTLGRRKIVGGAEETMAVLRHQRSATTAAISRIACSTRSSF